ncbi:MAG: hypothetical protein AVDCRST_MAG67-1124, partial [uncultured Solirubrobacteraceae bacterium]
ARRTRAGGPSTARCSGCADDKPLLRDRDPHVLRRSRATALPCRLRRRGGGHRDLDRRDPARTSAGSGVADGARMGVDASRRAGRELGACSGTRAAGADRTAAM